MAEIYGFLSSPLSHLTTSPGFIKPRLTLEQRHLQLPARALPHECVFGVDYESAAGIEPMSLLGKRSSQTTLDVLNQQIQEGELGYLYFNKSFWLFWNTFKFEKSSSKDFSTFALLTLWTREFFVINGGPGHWKIFNTINGLYLVDASNASPILVTKYIFRHCQTTLWGKAAKMRTKV